MSAIPTPPEKIKNYPILYQELVDCTNLTLKNVFAAIVVGAPNAALAPLMESVNVVIICVVVTKTSAPSGVVVFNGKVTVPVANVPAGCNKIHCVPTGVGTAILKPVVGTYMFVDTVGEAKVC
jgi:hypothetical protein